MAHKTLVGGTAYEISGGKTLVNGTAFSIKNGKTLVGGTAYGVEFGEKVTITISRSDAYNNNPGYSWVEIDGQSYYGNATPIEISVKVGTKIVCWAGSSTGTSILFACTLNGESITPIQVNTTPWKQYYELTAMTDTNIVLFDGKLPFGNSYGGGFHITTS